MKFIKYSVLFCLFFGCQVKQKKENIVSQNINDTLFITEITLRGKDEISNIEKEFLYKNNNLNLPKGETIRLNMKYKRELKELLKNCDVHLIKVDTGLVIRKKDNNNFDLYINKNYSRESVRLDFYVSPKKNYVIKSIYDDKIISFPSKTGICQFMQPVEP
jgi:hypothetical protein